MNVTYVIIYYQNDVCILIYCMLTILYRNAQSHIKVNHLFQQKKIELITIRTFRLLLLSFNIGNKITCNSGPVHFIDNHFTDSTFHRHKFHRKPMISAINNVSREITVGEVYYRWNDCRWNKCLPCNSINRHFHKRLMINILFFRVCHLSTSLYIYCCRLIFNLIRM